MKTSVESHPFTCPWWLIYTFDNPLRRLLHNPDKILGAYVRPGDTVLDVGCGMGYFTPTLARRVGDSGRVIAADLQEQMLAGLHRRAERTGLLGRIQFVTTAPDHIGIPEALDFALAFWMVHEVHQPEAFLGEIYTALKPAGRLLIVEPLLHVSGLAFDRTVALAQSLGFTVQDNPRVRFSRSVLLGK